MGPQWWHRCEIPSMALHLTTMFPIRFFYNKACNWSIGFLQIVNISKLYHMLGSNHSPFYVWSFQVSFSYKFLVLKMWTLLLTKYMWKTITFHCLPSSRWSAMEASSERASCASQSLPQHPTFAGSCCQPWHSTHVFFYMLIWSQVIVFTLLTFAMST
jgi:hypothetical protein